MTRKPEYKEATHIGSARVGLAILRMQPMHRGHANLINLMRQDCDIAIVGFGSTQKAREIGNPFSFEQRLEMVRAVVGDTIKPLQLVDIDSQVSTDDWVDYVLDKIKKMNLPEPTDMYCGSPQDAKWYMNRFAKMTDRENTVGAVTTHHSDKTGKRLHILDRDGSRLPQATEIRSLIERRDDEWKEYVPGRLVQYIDWHYPPELRVAVQGDTTPEIDPAHPTYPVGTLFLTPDKKVFKLHDDSKWREFKPK